MVRFLLRETFHDLRMVSQSCVAKGMYVCTFWGPVLASEKPLQVKEGYNRVLAVAACAKLKEGVASAPGP